MKKIFSILFIFSLFVWSERAFSQSYVPLFNEQRMAVEPQIPIKAYPIPLNQVRLLDGPFKVAMEADRRWLLSLEPDRFLNRFHENANLPVKGEIYGGWEDSTQSGFCFGHYLSAMSMLYAATGDPEVKAKLDYSVSELKKCQDAKGTGYVGGIPDSDKFWDEVINDRFELIGTGWIKVQGTKGENGVWVPWYNLHKLWAGLTDIYLFTGDETAKEIVVGLTDWVIEKFKDFTPEQWQRMLHCETGGMNDALYNVYAITGDPRHLELAEKFYHEAVLDPLSEQRNELPGLHANTQIPKITGAARSHELGANDKDKTIATFFWQTVRHDHSYCIGGNSDHEHFGEPRKLTLSDTTTETCNTYNMLKLTRHLFAWEPTAEYMDFYERALYNHILASQNPETGMVVYYLPLAYNSFKNYSHPTESFYCCVGTGFENHVKYAESIYYENENDLYINLFIPSELNWERQGMRILQETTFPDSDKTELTITTPSAKALTFHIRYPEWATEGYSIKINGTEQTLTTQPGSYVTINRTWSDGDKIEIEMIKTLRSEMLLGDDHKTAFMNGPIVLAGEIEPQNRQIVFLAEEDLDSWIIPQNQEKTEFETSKGYPTDVNLIPFYKKHEGYYAVYFDCYTAEEWEAVKEEYEKEEERQRELDRLTIDYFRPNEQQQEVDHNFKGTNVGRGDGALGKKWCDSDGGYFSFELEVNPDLPNGLMLTYWGNDGGNRKFDLLIDEEVIAVEELTGNFKKDDFFDLTYPIPFHLTKGKQKVTVKLRAHSGNKAGGIFHARTLLKKDMAESNIEVTDYLLPDKAGMDAHGLVTNGARGTFKGHPWVDANPSSELYFKMNCSPVSPVSLLLSYWGGEGDKRNFQILVEDTPIFTQELYMNRPEELFDVRYEVPQTLTKNKQNIKISLKGNPGAKAGGLFYAYTFSEKDLTGIEKVEKNNFPFEIYVQDAKINLIAGKVVNGILSLYTSNGQLLYKEIIKDKKEICINQNILAGIYTVQFISAHESVSYTKKIIV